jgi:hypothetical protein
MVRYLPCLVWHATYLHVYMDGCNRPAFESLMALTYVHVMMLVSQKPSVYKTTWKLLQSDRMINRWEIVCRYRPRKHRRLTGGETAL